MNHQHEPYMSKKTAADTRADGHAKGIGRGVFYHRWFNNNSDQN
jgi:hypothetical protein